MTIRDNRLEQQLAEEAAKEIFSGKGFTGDAFGRAADYVRTQVESDRTDNTMVARDTEVQDLEIESTEDPENLHLDVEFGTLQDLKTIRPTMSELFIPEVGKKFYIRTLDGREVDAYRSSLLTGKGTNQTINQRGMRSKLVVLALGNPDGTRMLTDRDTSEVQTWPSKVLERIFDRARKWNGLTEEDTDTDAGNS